jgi:hypothetical protein
LLLFTLVWLLFLSSSSLTLFFSFVQFSFFFSAADLGMSCLMNVPSVSLSLSPRLRPVLFREIYSISLPHCRRNLTLIWNKNIKFFYLPSGGTVPVGRSEPFCGSALLLCGSRFGSSLTSECRSACGSGSGVMLLLICGNSV